MPKPTQEQLENALEVMEYVLASIREHAPYVFNSIGALEMVIDEFPRDTDQIEETS